MAAIDFPNSPTIGDLFTQGDITWEWTGTVWKGLGDTTFGPAGVAISDDEPASNEVLWLDTNEEPDVPVPAGGSAGQVLTKVNSTDYNTQWRTSDGVRVFADASARTAAIPTPTEGIVTYLNDVDALQVHNGSAWVSPLGTTLITSQNFTSTSSVVVNDVFSSQFDAYQILITVTSASSAGDMAIQLQIAGTPAATNYNWIRTQAFLGGTGVLTTTSSSSAGVGRHETTGGICNILLNRPFIAATTYGLARSFDGTLALQTNGINHTTAASYTGFVLAVSGATGNIRVYGLRK